MPVAHHFDDEDVCPSANPQASEDAAGDDGGHAVGVSGPVLLERRRRDVGTPDRCCRLRKAHSKLHESMRGPLAMCLTQHVFEDSRAHSNYSTIGFGERRRLN